MAWAAGSPCMAQGTEELLKTGEVQGYIGLHRYRGLWGCIGTHRDV